jgi:hypothetical protein
MPNNTRDAEESATEQEGVLIEVKHADPGNPQWVESLCGNGGAIVPVITYHHNCALRFARKADADKVIAMFTHPELFEATDHLWIAKADAERRMLALVAKTSPGQWTVRDAPAGMIGGGFIVEAARQPGQPYGQEILAEDYLPENNRRADAEFIVAAREYFHLRLANRSS